MPQFNPLNYPICFDKPRRLTEVTSWHEHIPFAFTIVQMLKPKIIVELGTHKGDSYCAFCQAVDTLGLDTSCYAIDSWEGDEQAGFYGHEILKELRAYHDPLYGRFSRLIQSRFDEALDHFSDGSIDLLHIDGLHTYEAVKHDFEKWLPKMSKNGIILLHDTNVHENDFGVWRLCEDLKEKFSGFEFKYGHGLSMLSVGGKVPEELSVFLKENEVTITRFFYRLGSEIRLTHTLQVMDVQITELTNTLQERNDQITELTNSVQAKEKQIIELSCALQAMQQSLVWRLLMKYDNLVEKLLPENTGRRKIYDHTFKTFRIILNEGWGSSWRKYKESERTKKLLEQTSKNCGKIQKSSLKNWKGERIVFLPPLKNPEVSIVIPVHNNFKYTFNCLNSILKNTKGSFEVIVVDDASNDETPNLLKNVENIKVVRNDINEGFIESCNRGAKLSSGKYILFLNNDTIVTDNWLEPLKNAISKDDVGVVGAKLIYPDGKLQEAGGIIWNDASGWNYGKFDNHDKPEYNFVREVDYCSGAALLVKKELFEKLRGFDVRFKPGYYEDTDLCFSIRKSGYKVLYQPNSIIIHFEGATGGTDINSGAKKYQEVNKSKFYDKWKDILEKDHYNPDSANLLFYARNRSKGKNILIIDHYIPTFDKDSGSYRMYNILKILSELGHKVTFIGDSLARLQPYTEILQQCGIEVIYTPYTKSIKDYLANNGRFFDAVILSRSHIAMNHIFSVKKYCTKAKKILDTVDLQYLREIRRSTVENNKDLMTKANKLKKMELELTKECDVTLVVSPVEKEILLEEVPSLKIEILSNIHQIFPPKKPFSERKDIMFLGGFDHLPNIDAVKFFVKDILPFVKIDIPDMKFYIVGSNPPEEIIRLKSDSTIVTGYVKDLTPYFENCRISVAPLRYGAGVKGKIGEAMAHGLPVVTTSIGAEGMNLTHGDNILISDEPNEFAGYIVRLYNEEDLWNTISNNSIKHLKDNLSYEVNKNKIREFIGDLFVKN